MNIGILITDQSKGEYIDEFIEWCDAQEFFKCNLTIYSIPSKLSVKNLLPIYLWKLINFFEVLLSAPRKISSKHLMLKNEDIKNINSHNVDLFIAFSFHESFKTFLEFSTHGLLFFHSDVNLKNKIGPLGFSEVLSKKSNSGFSIIHFSKKDQIFHLIFEGYFPTFKSFSQNIRSINQRKIFYLQNILQKLAKSNFDLQNAKKLSRVLKDPDYPSLKKQIEYLYHLFESTLRSIKRKYVDSKSVVFQVFFTNLNWQKIKDVKLLPIENPADGYFADPFLIEYENNTYCFMENFNYKTQKGSIAACILKDNSYKILGNILEENFHLSFPYLFKFNSKIYMIPESCGNRDIRIYECKSFPDKWSLKTVIFNDIKAVDSMIFPFDGKWWLFTNVNPNNTSDRCSELLIFYSDDPINGIWSAHELNPVIVNSSNGRNGGLLKHNGNLFRVSQKQGYGEYGVGFEINKIIALDKNIYLEQVIQDQNEPIFSEMINSHHLHSNNKYSVLDRWSYKKIIN